MTMELLEGRSPDAIVIQPQIEEMDNVENELDTGHIEKGNGNPEFIPTPDGHTMESECLSTENEDSDNFEIVIQPQDDDLENERYNTQLQNRDSNLEINPTFSLPKDDTQFLVSQDKECDNMETVIQRKKEVAAKENEPNKNCKQIGNSGLGMDPSTDLHKDKPQFIEPQNEHDQNFEIVIQPQSDEEENLDNEPSYTEVHSRDGNLEVNSTLDSCTDESQCPISQGDESYEIRPLHVVDMGNNQSDDPILEINCSPEFNMQKSSNTVIQNKDSVNLEIKPTLDHTAGKMVKVQVSDTEKNETCSFRLTEYWSHGNTNKITAVYSPVNTTNPQISNIQIEESTMDHESDYDTESASENGDSATDTNIVSHYKEKETPKTDNTIATTDDVSENSGIDLIKEEELINAYQWQNDKGNSKLPNKELVIKLKDLSKESQITFFEQKEEGDESGGHQRAKTSRTKKIAEKCPDCNEWTVGKLINHKLRTYCMISRCGKKLKCTKCGCLFTRTKAYMDHFKACDIEYRQEESKIESLVDEKGKRTIECMICKKVIVGRNCFLEHFVNSHLHSLENDNDLKLEFKEKLGEIRCLICGKFEMTRASVRRHFTLAHDLKFPFYSCNQCNVGTCNYDHLVNHWQETHPNLIGQCELCSEWLPKSEIEKHVKSKHTGNPRFCSLKALVEQIKADNSENQLVDSNKIKSLVDDKAEQTIKCMSCDKLIISKPSFLVHFVNAHLDSLNNSKGLKRRFTFTERIAEDYCLICGKLEAKSQSLLHHFTVIHNLKPPFYTCKQCNAATCSYDEFFKHWKEAHPNLIEKCEFCLEWLPKSEITKHLKSQHKRDQSRHTATKQGKTNDEFKDKKKHQSGHKATKQQKTQKSFYKVRCPKCDKNVRIDRLWLHSNSPNLCASKRDKSSIICLSCNQAFINKQFLLVHYVHVHLQGLGDQNNGFNLQYTPKGDAIGIQCLICDKYEPTTQALLGHFGEVHNLTVQYYGCIQCTAATCSYDELTRHWQETHPTEPKKCELCSKWLSTIDIKNHLQFEHFLFKCEKCNVYVSIHDRDAHERMQCRLNKTLQEKPVTSLPETKHVPQTLKKPDDIIKSVRIANPTL